MVFYPQSIPASLQRPVRGSYGNRQNRDFVILFFFFFLERPTARLVGPETMIHSPNCFALPCAVPFHKINAGYEETTTTVNSSCLMLASKPGLLPQFRTQLRAPTIKCVGEKNKRFSHVMRALTVITRHTIC